MSIRKSCWSARVLITNNIIPGELLKIGKLSIHNAGWWTGRDNIIVLDSEADSAWYASSMNEAVAFCIGRVAEKLVNNDG